MLYSLLFASILAELYTSILFFTTGVEPAAIAETADAVKNAEAVETQAANTDSVQDSINDLAEAETPALAEDDKNIAEDSASEDVEAAIPTSEVTADADKEEAAELDSAPEEEFLVLNGEAEKAKPARRNPAPRPAKNEPSKPSDDDLGIVQLDLGF